MWGQTERFAPLFCFRLRGGDDSLIFLPCGREALRLTGVWDVCAARGKVGPVMGLRPANFLMPNSALRVWAAIGDAVAGRKDTDISR